MTSRNRYKFLIASVCYLNSSITAMANDADVTIRYGSNIKDMTMWIELIEEEGVKVQALMDLENPNCVVIVYEDEEIYRFSSKSVDDATMADIAIAIGQRDDNHGFTKSDCPKK